MLRPTYNTLASEHSGAVEGPNPIVETSLVYDQATSCAMDRCSS